MLIRTKQPDIQELKNINLITPQRKNLPNGVPLYIINAGIQDVVRIDIIISGGKWNQFKELQALLTNRMLREGTKTYMGSVISEKLDYYGAWLELSCSAQHSYLSLYSLNKYLPQTVRILESILKEPTFPEKEFQIVMSNNLQEFLVEKDKVTYISRNGLLRALYGENHPQGKNIQVADFTSILPDDLHDFYERYYSSDNFTIFLSGKITPEVEKIVTYSFGYSSFGNSLYKSVDTDFPIMKDTEKRIFINRDDALQSAVYMGNLTISRHHQDFKKLRVLITLFGGYFGSRLMSNIREDKGYTYDISANIISYPDSGMIRISSETSNEYVEPLIREVYHEIDVLQEDLVSDDELIMVRNYMIGNLCRSCESAFSLANLWQFVYTQGLKDSYFNDLLQSIREVTPEELRKLARTYLCKNILKEVVTGKKSS